MNTENINAKVAAIAAAMYLKEQGPHDNDSGLLTIESHHTSWRKIY